MAKIVSVELARGAGAAATGAGAAGRWAMGAAVARGAMVGAAAVARPGTVGPPLGPPGGTVGNLIVGAVEGLGGKLMRTVSFLGCTLPVSFFGGTAPAGMLGMFSGIKTEPRYALCQSCQTLKANSAKREPEFGLETEDAGTVLDSRLATFAFGPAATPPR